MMSQPKMLIASPVTVTASFDPPIIRPGEEAIYRVSFNALEESIDWPKKIPAPSALQMHPGAHGQLLQMAGSMLEPHTSFNTHVRISNLGEFTVPEFTLKVYDKPVAVPAAHITVVSAPPPGVPPAQRVELEIPSANLFLGQAIRARILWPGSAAGAVQVLQQVQLSGEGFLVDQSAIRQSIQPLPRGGVSLPTYIYETTVIPITAGKVSLFAQGYTAGMRASGPFIISGNAIIPGGMPAYTLLDSEPVDLQVRALPREGQLPGFTGAIGSFSLEPPQLSTNVVRVGDPVTLSVTLRGNLARVVPPPPPRVRDWQVFKAAGDMGPQPIAAFGPMRPGLRAQPIPEGQTLIKFSYTLLPLTAGTQATPPIPFSYFDPSRGVSADLTIPSIPVTVQPGAAPADLEALLQPDAVPVESEAEPVLSDLAAAPGFSAASLAPVQQQLWFPLLQLLPAASLLGLWSWDRRRRFFELHPEVLLRRRARRALRRECRNLRRAAQTKDAPRFAASAINAMRVACAPHFPAEPRALVGADVLQLLQSGNGSARTAEVVRRFFAVTDAAQFAANKVDPAELLSLQPELEAVLQQLEQRL
jgi:hypothetical protein